MKLKNIWLFIIPFILFFVTRAVLSNFFYPVSDNNLQAYSLLLEGLETGHYELMRKYATEAYELSDDETLKKCADFFYQSSDLLLSFGCTTFEEADSFIGIAKGFLAGFLNPLKSAKATILIIKGWYIEKDFKYTDEKYFSKWEKDKEDFRQFKMLYRWVPIIVFAITTVIVISTGFVTNKRISDEFEIAIEDC